MLQIIERVKDKEQALRMEKQRIRLSIEQVFYGALLGPIPFIEDYSIQTMCTNSLVIKYNPKFAATCSDTELRGVIVHEILHIALCHHIRRGTRDPRKWNYATDYAINLIVLDDPKLALPKGVLYDTAYRDMSSEKIYATMPDPPKETKSGKGKPGQPGDGKPEPGQLGDVEDMPGENGDEPSPAEKAREEERVQYAVDQAAKCAGYNKLPGGLKRIVDQARKAVVDWKSVMQQFFQRHVPSDYTFQRPNRRFIGDGLYLPSLWCENIGEIACMVDVSGSVTVPQLNQASGELDAIMQTLKPEALHVIYFDHMVQRYQRFEPGDTVKLESCGGGGTDFKPPFTYLQENNITPRCIVVLTDLCCYSYPDEPDFPVLWACTLDDYREPPFGEVVPIGDCEE